MLVIRLGLGMGATGLTSGSSSTLLVLFGFILIIIILFNQLDQRGKVSIIGGADFRHLSTQRHLFDCRRLSDTDNSWVEFTYDCQ